MLNKSNHSALDPILDEVLHGKIYTEADWFTITCLR